MHSAGPARVCRRPAGAHVPPACERLPCTGRHDPDSTGLCTVFTNGTTKRYDAPGARSGARGWQVTGSLCPVRRHGSTWPHEVVLTLELPEFQRVRVVRGL